MNHLDHAIGKVMRRIVPLFFFCLVAAYLDRVNVGFAALEMNGDLKFSPSIFGFGAGVFFLGYVLAGVPSNILLERTGARIWITVAMVCWGVLGSSMALVHDATSFYVLRFLIGVAEAGFVPGFYLFIVQWVPRAYQGRAVSRVLAAVPVGAILFAPVSGWILSLGDALGLRSWQLLFVTEGLPSILLGGVVWLLLNDRVEEATWLTPGERQALATCIEDEQDAVAVQRAGKTDGKVVTPIAIALGLTFFGLSMSNYGVLLWLPQIVKSFGLSNLAVGFISVIPFAAALSGVLLFGWHSDKRRERPLHVAAGAFLSAAAFLAIIFVSAPLAMLVIISLAAFGYAGGGTVLWTMPSQYLTARNAAGGIALANSIGNIGGFIGPYTIGYVKQEFGSYTLGSLLLCSALAMSGVIALALWNQRRTLPGHEHPAPTRSVVSTVGSR